MGNATHEETHMTAFVTVTKLIMLGVQMENSCETEEFLTRFVGKGTQKSHSDLFDIYAWQCYTVCATYY